MSGEERARHERLDQRDRELSGEERARHERLDERDREPSGGRDQQHGSGADELERDLDLDERAQLLIDSLTDDEAAKLATTVTEARAEYAGALDAFAEGALAALPRPLRGRAARILSRGR